MYGELTDKETVSRLEYSLENQQQDQFEVLLYKKNSKFMITCTIYSVFVTVSLLTRNEKKSFRKMFGKYFLRSSFSVVISLFKQTKYIETKMF